VADASSTSVELKGPEDNIQTACQGPESRRSFSFQLGSLLPIEAQGSGSATGRCHSIVTIRHSGIV
jgi:hypothetical protein